MQCEQSTTVFSMPIRVLQQLLIWEWKRKTHPTFFLFSCFLLCWLVPLLPKKVTYQVSVRSLFCVWSKIGTLLNSLLRTTIFKFFENGVTCMQFDREYRFLRILSKFRFLLKMKLPLSKDSVNSRSFVKGKVFFKTYHLLGGENNS